jgi:hypothetical protein
MSLRDQSRCLDVELRVARLDAAIITGLGQFGTAVTRAGADVIRMRAAGEVVLPAIARWLVARGADVYALHGRRRTLEEWFIDIMGDDQRPG